MIVENSNPLQTGIESNIIPVWSVID